MLLYIKHLKRHNLGALSEHCAAISLMNVQHEYFMRFDVAPNAGL